MDGARTDTATPRDPLAKAGGRMKVALISMPTLTASVPSFQLGLLKPTLERADIDVQPFSMYLYFGAHIGWKLNDTLGEVRGCLAGEWIWSRAAFGDFADDKPYFEHYQRNYQAICRAADCTVEDILDVRDRKTFSFIRFCLDAVDWSRFDVIGFTVVFQQLSASIALARALKERHPDIPIILGGATFEDDIADSIMQGCPWIDHVHCGDADTTFPDFVHRLGNGIPLDGLKGIMWRQDGKVRFEGRAPNLSDMNATPIPDFDEYFYARKESGYDAWAHAKDPMLPIETARGCWWGMKHHCTFCGLNRAGMEFRSKSVDQVLELLETLSNRYGILHFDAIDNIMDRDYIAALFGELGDRNTDIQVHYEVRPYLTREQLKNLRRGGLFSVQPGIESLSTRVLKLMKKHSTGMRNLAFMKWCTYYGINNLYNILTGFAGERAEDYEMQCDVIEKIPHFQPPWAVAQARADRGSPMFTDPESHEVLDLAPSPCYRNIFPEDRFDYARVSYYFEHRQGDIPEEEQYYRLYTLAYHWQQAWKTGKRATLKYFKAWQSIRIEDTRGGTLRKETYTGREAELYEYCNDPRALLSIVDRFDGDADWVQDALSEFIARDLIVHLDDQYLSLALPANKYV